jgi:hypothetical protein
MFKQTTALLIAIMMMSLLLPVLASAAVTFQGTFASNGSVSGQVYFNDTVGDAVYGQSNVTLSVYSKNGQYIQDVTVAYSTYSNGSSYYSIPGGTVIPSVYDAVYFMYDTTVTGVVYRQTSSGGCTNCWSGGGGGGGSYSSSTLNAFNGSISASELSSALANNTEVTINVTGDHLEFPLSALLNAKEGAVIKVVTENGTYYLPISAIDFDEWSKLVDADINTITVNIDIKKLAGDDAKPVQNAISSVGGKALSEAVDFNLSIESTNGNTADITTFDQYIKRAIPLTSEPSKPATVAFYNPATKALSFVPGNISDTEAEFWRNSNSIYTVIELSKSFQDIAVHWGKADIELLAGKLIIDGVTDNTFEPDRSITRAEFAALAVRSLGLIQDSKYSYFNDVASGSWYAGVVNAAAKAGLVNGYEDGTFRPDERITREELAAIIIRSYQYAGGTVEVDDAAVQQILSKWSDASQIIWGQREVAAAIQVGLMNGMTDTTLETYGSATRAQTAAMVKRFLTEVKFID